MKQTTPTIPYLCISSFGQTAWLDLDESTNALIGSGSHCKVQVSGSDVRSLHCIVAMKDDRLEVRDWNTGCTFVNGQAISEPTELKEGDSLKIGDSEITAVLSESGHAEIQSLMTAMAEAEGQPETPVVESVASETAEFETPSPRVEVPTLAMDSSESFGQPETPASEFVAAETAETEFAAPSPRAEASTLELAGTEADVLSETPVGGSVEVETTELTSPSLQAQLQTLVLDGREELSIDDQPETPVGEAVEIETAETAACENTVAESEFNEEPAPIEEGEPVVETEVQHESESSEPELTSEVPAAEAESEPEDETQIPVQSEVPVEAQTPVEPEVQVEPEAEAEPEPEAETEPEVQVEAASETETDPQPAGTPAEFIYDINADIEDETDPAFGFASPGFTDQMNNSDELQLLRMENEQLRFELNEQAKRSFSSEENSELLSRDQTVRLVSRLEDMLAELKRSDARSLQMEELLRSADQATQDEQEERKQMEKWVSELENRVTQRESESNDEIQSLKSMLEEARRSQQKSNVCLQAVIASKAAGESDPDELVSGLRQQIESLQTQLRSSQEQCTAIREQLENRPESSPENGEQIEKQMVEMQLETARERADVSRQRVELQRLRMELEERLKAPREASDADTRISAMREHLKELHDKKEENADQPVAASNSLGNRIAGLLQRVAGQ